MRDDDLTFIEAVQRDLHTVRWAEPAELRARARRRSRRTAVAAAVAVLALTSGAAFVASRGATVPASAPAAASPSAPAWIAAEVPAEALLQPVDLRPAIARPWNEAGLGEEIRLDQMLEVCRKDQGLVTRWEQSRYSRSVAIVRERPGGVDKREGQVLAMQDLYRVPPDRADHLFDGLPALLGPCRQWRSSGPTAWRGTTITAEVVHSWQEVDRDFAGDESVLVRHTVGQARNLDTGAPLDDRTSVTAQAVVRVGDLVSVLRYGSDGSESQLRDLARVAAERMCVAANPGC
ncbi:hypothetical protein O7602_24515 [Micromonospora sp. WMMD1128]|uniref:hypothetical protein n=1 Tax=Micromonospora sp. WMMD1128 TaxID=3015150 RepID=UPI00248BECB5|nr:hypothetical protein [Micromonospora sp. WMMD1128]WBB72832.1 hypothetical protein O7602_24515 [Micromonospora sp. WMMD1128]